MLVAQSADRDSRRNLLLTGMALGLGLGLPVLISIVLFLSLPLFAASLLWLGDTMTPTKIGAMWLLTYAIYAGFNAYALARVMRSSAIGGSKAR